MDTFIVPPRVLAGDFAGWLRDEMVSRKLNPRMLAVRTGMDHSTIYRLSIGAHKPTLASAVALIRVLTASPISGPFAVELPRWEESTAQAEVA